MLGSTISTSRVVALVTILALAAALAACGSVGNALAPAGGDNAMDQDGRGLTDTPDAGEGVPGGTGADGSDPAPGGSAPLGVPIEQRIVKTGEVTAEVENVAESLGRVRAMAVELGGYVGGSQAGTLDDRATLTVRIPADAFDEAVGRIHELGGTVLAEATREQDVTGQVVDLGARIDNLRASETSYRELVARAERIEDILAVQSRLDQVRGEIEQLQAQLDALEGQAALSTLTVTLVPRAEPIAEQAEDWSPGTQLDRALASLVGIGQGLIDGLIWFGIVWLPMLLVLAIIGLVALRGVLEVRRRLPPPMVATSPSPGDEGGA